MAAAASGFGGCVGSEGSYPHVRDRSCARPMMRRNDDRSLFGEFLGGAVNRSKRKPHLQSTISDDWISKVCLGFRNVKYHFIQQGGGKVSAIMSSWVRWFLAHAAIAPPEWKTPLFERACASLVRNVVGVTEELIVTNLGLNADLRFVLLH
jgi:hypothetical protein